MLSISEAKAYDAEYRARPAVKARMAEYQAEYQRRPEVRARMNESQRERRATPEGKAREAEYNRTPEAKARRFEYRSRPEAKARRGIWIKEQRATDPQFRMAGLLRSRLNSAIKNKSKRGSAVDLLDCSIAALVFRFETRFADGMTWENQGEWHLDHIQPLSSFDLEDVDQLAVACHYSNLQPLWARDNLIKSNKRKGKSWHTN